MNTGKPAMPTSLYASAEKIHPRMAQGRYARLRILAMLLLLGLYYVLPWLQVNGQPLVLFDLPARRFHVFGMTLFPQDLFLLTWLLLIAAMTLFFFTTVLGRVWCGYACPQTVWTEAFVWVERLIEGERHIRMKRDKAPWTASKLLIRGSKHLAWIAMAGWTGLTFVAYFVPAHTLFPEALSFQLRGWSLFWVTFYGFATWGNAGFMREQVCKYMCPYARFQSSMFDRDTLIVGYDAKRGEPRKSVARLAHQAAGDCVDCTLCVQVCPTGIDIRQGLQYECIACAACVDVCNGVMDQVGKPRGLIRYTSSHAEQGGRMKLLRPRMLGYGAVWMVLCVGFLVLALGRNPLQLDVLRDRRQLYRELADGSVINVYTLKLGNKTDHAVILDISARLGDGRAVELSVSEAEIPAEGQQPVTLSARVPAGTVTGVADLVFRVDARGDADIHREQASHFFGASP